MLAWADRRSSSQQDGETLSGTYQGTFDTADVSGTIQGDRIEFSFEGAGEHRHLHRNG